MAELLAAGISPSELIFQGTEERDCARCGPARGHYIERRYPKVGPLRIKATCGRCVLEAVEAVLERSKR